MNGFNNELAELSFVHRLFQQFMKLEKQSLLALPATVGLVSGQKN